MITLTILLGFLFVLPCYSLSPGSSYYSTFQKHSAGSTSTPKAIARNIVFESMYCCCVINLHIYSIGSNINIIPMMVLAIRLWSVNGLLILLNAQWKIGRMKGMISGGAPLTAQCQEFIRVCFSAPIIQGYGLTEVKKFID